MSQAVNEIERRRTFAIISHPDAGKTTLTIKTFAIRWRTEAGRNCEVSQIEADWGYFDGEKQLYV